MGVGGAKVKVGDGAVGVATVEDELVGSADENGVGDNLLV